MKKGLIFVVICIICASFAFMIKEFSQVFALDGDIIEYEIYDTEGNLLTFSSEAEIGDTILTRDFVEYQIYKIDGTKCEARELRKLHKPSDSIRENRSIQSTMRKLCLYMTHNDESYTPSDGYDSIYGAGGIHDVAKKIKSEFEKENIKIVLDETLHIPHNNSAYSRSSTTANRLFRDETPDALFDIHRDGVSRKYYLTNYEGKPYSKIRIVVGKSNPNFEENYKFAQEVFEKGNELYPWLFLDIYCGKGHYNQELMPTNLLFEMGTYLIEKEYVMASVPFLTDVISKVLYVSDEKSDMVVEKEEVVPNENNAQEENKGGRNAVGVVIAGVCLAGLVGFTLIALFRRRKIEIK